LLGGERPDVAEFVENVSMYRSGEHLKSTAIDDDGDNNNSNNNNSKDEKKSNVATSSVQKDRKPKDSESHRKQKQSKKSKLPSPRKNIGTTTSNNNESRPISPRSVRSGNNNNDGKDEQSALYSSHGSIKNNQASNLTVTDPSKYHQQQQPIIDKYQPTSGKAKLVCGCFGTKHKPLTNCLYCGRISCELEGYHYCPFCTYMVEAGIEGDDKASIQKNRLLRFDREFARRTQIIDDQSDFQMPSTWMSEDERKEAEENQQKQLESLKRPKQTLLNLGM